MPPEVVNCRRIVESGAQKSPLQQTFVGPGAASLTAGVNQPVMTLKKVAGENGGLTILGTHRSDQRVSDAPAHVYVTVRFR
jgi:hypothetical protein